MPPSPSPPPRFSKGALFHRARGEHRARLYDVDWIIDNRLVKAAPARRWWCCEEYRGATYSSSRKEGVHTTLPLPQNWRIIHQGWVWGGYFKLASRITWSWVSFYFIRFRVYKRYMIYKLMLYCSGYTHCRLPFSAIPGIAMKYSSFPRKTGQC